MNTTEKFLQKIALFLAVVAVVQVMLLLILTINYQDHVNTEKPDNHEEYHKISSVP